MLKKLARVNAINSVLYFVDPTRLFFSHEYVKNFSYRETAHAQKKYQESRVKSVSALRAPSTAVKALNSLTLGTVNHTTPRGRIYYRLQFTHERG